MLSKFNIINNEIIPICVMATMSSGKSTFLNAVLGDAILPEKNEACTARALAVVNAPGMRDAKAYIRKTDGEKYAVDVFDSNTVSRINEDETVTDVLIVKEIESLTYSDKTIVLVDTPGVNNSGDIRHAERTKEILGQLTRGVIVYLLNATQLATNDDELLLQMVIEHVKRCPEVRIIFVLNKIDMLDEDKESIPDIIRNASQYIREHGISEFGIYPLSALSAKTFRMTLNGRTLTKAEARHMNQSYHEYQDNSRSMLQYVGSYNRMGRTYLIDNQQVSEYSLRRAIENTGIVEIEREIGRIILLLEHQPPKWTDALKDYEKLEGVYSQKCRTKNFANYSGEVYWICKKCRQINGKNEVCMHCKQPNVKWFIQ